MRIAAYLLLFISLTACTRHSSGASNTHLNYPLDPLTKEEIATAVSVLKASGKASESTCFPMIVLNELPKQEILNYKPGDPMRREAFVVAYERASNSTAEAIVDVNTRK